MRPDLQVLLREWYGYHWHEAQKELAEAHQVVTRMRRSSSRHARTWRRLKPGWAACATAIQALRLELNQWHKQLAEQHARREETIRLLVVAEERQRSLLSQQSSDQQAILNLAEEMAFQQEQLANSEKEIARLNAELEEARQQSGSARQALAERQKERLQAEARAASRPPGAGRSECPPGTAPGPAGGKPVAGGTQSRSARNRPEGLERSRAGSKSRRLSVARQPSKLPRQPSRRSRRRKLRCRASANACKRPKRQLARLREQRSGLAVEQARLKAQLDVLDQAEAAWSGYASGARLLLQAASQNRLPGARGALNAFLETPAELEKAIAAALGEFLDAVLLEDDPDQAMDLLQRGSGRGVLLPLERPATRCCSAQAPGC